MVSSSTDPQLGAIRLAWWRDRLDDLDSGRPIAGEPRLDAIHRHLLKVTNGATLATIAGAWMPLLDPFPWGEDAAFGLRKRGETLFAVGSQILCCAHSSAEPAGALWSLVDGALHCSDPDSRGFLRSEAGRALADVPQKIPRALRPMTVLAALAASDLLGRGAAGRVTAALVHRLTGNTVRS